MADEAVRQTGNNQPVLAGVVVGTTDIKMVRVDANGNLLIAASTAAVDSVVINPQTSGGLTTYTNLDTQQVGIAVSTAPCQLYGYDLFNAAATLRAVKLYDVAVVPTTSMTAKLTLVIPAGGGKNVFGDIGAPFATGLGIRAVTGIPDTSTGAPTANDVVSNLFYK